FATSCAGDVNTGHPVSIDSEVPDTGSRTFEQCDVVGRSVADAALRASVRPGAPLTAATSTSRSLTMDLPAPAELDDDLALWAEHAVDAPPESRALYDVWAEWAEQTRASEQEDWVARVSVFRW